MIKSQAKDKDREIISRANLHMELEDQAVKLKLNDRIDRLAVELIERGDIW
jgi:hypothetical protein